MLLLAFIGLLYFASTHPKKIAPAEPANAAAVLAAQNRPLPQCGLIDGYQIGMSISGFKDSYPKNSPAPACRLSSPKMVSCDGQMPVNGVPTNASFDFGYGNDYVDGKQFAFGDGKLFGIKGNFELANLPEIKQTFLEKFGVPQADKKNATGYEGLYWSKDGNAIMLSEIPDGEGYLFSIIPLDPQRLSACLSAH